MVSRKLLGYLKTHIPKKEFTIIIGARQTGKSTLLRQLELFCKQEGIPAVFLNLEQKSILAELNENPLNLLKFLPVTEQRVITFVDEVQYLDDPSNFLKLLFDEQIERLKIIATGSSAFYIDSSFKDSLAGRKRLFQLSTCTFDEYLVLGGKADLYDEFNRIKKKSETRSTLLSHLRMEWESYMIYGGYPAVVTEPDTQEKIEKLKEIRDSFVKRDILESGVQNETAFYNLFRILAEQTGNLVNINELSSKLRIKNETTASYLGIMQKCFHIALIKPFFRNLRKELIKMPKVYLLDTGLRNCLLNNFQPISQRHDKGALWETMVFRMLSDRYGQDEVRYWRTTAGNEIDFVLPHILSPSAIEAKYDLHQVRTSKYKRFKETYPEIPLNFAWMIPFNEDFFKRLL